MEIDIRKGWLGAIGAVAPLFALGALLLYSTIEMYFEGLPIAIAGLLVLLGLLFCSYGFYSVYSDINSSLVIVKNERLELYTPLVPNRLSVSLSIIEKIQPSTKRYVRIYLKNGDYIDVSTFCLSSSKVNILCSAKYNNSHHSPH